MFCTYLPHVYETRNTWENDFYVYGGDLSYTRVISIGVCALFTYVDI